MRQRGTYERIFQILLDQREAMRVAELSSTQDISIVDEAKVPIDPSWPKKSLILMVSLILGGFLGILIPEEYGGIGGDYRMASAWCETFGELRSVGLTVAVNMHSVVISHALAKYGSIESKDKWLSAAARGDAIGAYAFTEPGAGSAGPFRGSKTTLYEGGTRSPLIVWGPGLIDQNKAGRVNTKSIFAAFDLAPSLLSIAKINDQKIAFDGENIAPALLGQNEVSRIAPIYWRRPPDRKTAAPALPERLPDLAMRDGNWKLLCEYDGTQPKLYDLAQDRGETTNLAAHQPEIVARMTSSLLNWHQEMPPDNGPVLSREQPKAKGKKKAKSN